MVEGRIFGLEKGFEKFLEVGKLQGKCSVWEARIPSSSGTAKGSPLPTGLQITNPRAQKNIQALSLMLTHVPYKNDDNAVEEVEETLKKARVKSKMVERMLGEQDGSSKGMAEDGEQSIEDAGRSAAAATALQ